MSPLKLSLACWDYDRTRPLIDGRVKPEGLALQVTVMRPQQAFQAMLQRREFHAAEMSLANYTALKAKGDCPFIGIPVMLSKMFRHSCIYVRSEAGIRTPADLKGKRAGTAQFTSTGVVFVKGALQHLRRAWDGRPDAEIGAHQRPDRGDRQRRVVLEQGEDLQVDGVHCAAPILEEIISGMTLGHGTSAPPGN